MALAYYHLALDQLHVSCEREDSLIYLQIFFTDTGFVSDFF